MRASGAKVLTLSYLLFLVLLLVSGSIEWQIVSEIVYYSAFIAPIVMCEIYLHRCGERPEMPLRLGKREIYTVLLLAMPFVVTVGAVSEGVGALIYLLTGEVRETVLEGDIFTRLLLHACLPALLEETVFRYLPYRMLRGHSNATVIIVSALSFGVAHISLFSLPYALVAGAILMGVMIATRSVVTTFILHFVNNAISVLLMTYGGDQTVKNAIYVIICLLFVLSLAFIIAKRKQFITVIRDAVSCNGDKMFPTETLMYILCGAIVSFMTFGGAS